MNYIIIIFISLFFSISAFAAPRYMQLDVFAIPRVDFKITAPNGLSMGYDPTISSNLVAPNIEEIQGSTYGLLTMPDTPTTIGTEFIYYKNVMSGNYKIVCYGTGLSPYTIVIAYNYSIPTTPAILQVRKIGFANTGTIQTYEISVPDSPASSIIINKVASSNDLITDISTAGQLGYIGSSEFVSEITKKINKIEEKRLKPAEKDDDEKLTPAQKAKKEYTELLKEITEKYNKPEADEFVKKEAYDVLREDLEYIIGHL